MNNLEFLNKQVFYTGFGPDLEKELTEKLMAQQPQFSIVHQAYYGKDEAEATLHFKKSSQSDLYFFNSYDLTLKKGNQPDQVLKQTFYIGKENNITMKEAYNLLCGRAIQKTWAKLEKVGEGEEARYQPSDEKYDAWMQLDFNNVDDRGNFKAVRYHENYQFDLEKILEQQPIKGISSEEDKSQLIDSLKKGNRQSITLVDGDQVKQAFIEANPKDRTVNIYEVKGQQEQVKNEVAQKEKQTQTKQDQAVESPEKQVKKNAKREKRAGVRMG